MSVETRAAVAEVPEAGVAQAAVAEVPEAGVAQAAVADAAKVEPAKEEGLSAEDIQREEEFLRQIPKINIGALFMPPIWGMGHGDWPCLLFYPLWLFVDNLLYSAYSQTSALSVTLALIAFVVIAAVTVGYARISSPRAAHRAAAKGKTLEQYLRTERIWAIAMVIMGIAMIAGATYYNLMIRPGV